MGKQRRLEAAKWLLATPSAVTVSQKARLPATVAATKTSRLTAILGGRGDPRSKSCSLGLGHEQQCLFFYIL